MHRVEYSRELRASAVLPFLEKIVAAIFANTAYPCAADQACVALAELDSCVP